MPVRGSGDDGTGLQRPGDGSDDAPRMVVELGPERVSLSPGGGCWITDDGSAECWDGDDEWSQDGDFVQISAGTLFTCGVTSDSRVRCWSKEHGEGFYQSWWDTKQEISVSEGMPVKQVVVDGPHLCAIHTDGTLGCYGRKYYGFGPAVEGWEAPEPGPLPEGTFTQMSTGAWRYGDSSTGLSCAIRADTGRLACWDYGGERPAPQGQFSQVSVSHGRLSGAIYIGGIGVPHSAGVLVCGVLTDGRIQCWSDAVGGEGARSAMTEFYAPDGEFAQVSAGTRDICGLRSDGTIMCWGIGYREEIGGIRIGGDQQATVELAGDTRLARISVGDGRVCGIGTDGDLKCWTIPPLGDAQAQQGSGDTDSERQEGSAVVATDAHGVIRISGIGTGEYQILLDEGTWVPMFSADGKFRLSISRPDKTAACHEAIGTFALVGLGGAGAVARRGRAAVIGTGRNSMCEAGEFIVKVWTDSDTTRWGLDYRKEPVPGWGTGGAAVLNRSATDFVHIDAGTYMGGWRLSDAFPYVCGVRAGGGAECWGPGYRNGTEPPMDTFTEVAVGQYHTCALRADGAAQCWGWNRFGQSAPHAGPFAQLASAAFASCGLRLDGSVECWGLSPEDDE